ncbi:MAG: hypothetical protein K2L49_09225 [Muribaculaceae bacterium]|nr:hypothetical protein [Muribaculaceae bacterium]
MMEEPADERRQLYDRFRSELAENPHDIFFDEKELVEIYDQAGDLDDERVKLEVLMHGFRLYPDSEDLAVRRAYMYYNYHLDDGARDMWKNRERNSPLWDILQIRMTPDGSGRERLEKMIGRTDKFDDEEMIQIVDCASAIGEYEWLKDNFGKLRERCSYMPTLLYEMQIVASLNNDAAEAVKMLEGLTEIEPFNAEFWTILAEEQLKAGRAEEALSSVEYAIAISPDDPRPIMCKARAMVALDRGYPAVISMLESIKGEYADDSGFVQLLGVAYVNENRLDDAVALLSAYNKEYPADRAVIDYLLLLHYEHACDILDAYYSTSDASRDEKDWADWASGHHAQGHYAEAALIMECFDRNAGITRNRALYFSALYAARFYKVILQLFDYYMRPEHRDRMIPEIGITAVMSMLRLDRRDEALETARRLVAGYGINGEWSVGGVLSSIGAVTVLTMLISTLESGREVSVDDLDPFSPPVADGAIN